MGSDKPPEGNVGARIRVKAEHADGAAAAFDREGITPIYVEHRADGVVSFWFGKPVVGIIQSIEADGAVIKSDDGYVRVPVQAFGVCPTGLVLNMSAKQFKKLVMTAQGAK